MIRRTFVEFARFTHQSRIRIIKIAVRPREESGSFVDIAYTYTGISEKGNRFVDALSDEVFRADMKHWENAVNHFLKTGEKLK